MNLRESMITNFIKAILELCEDNNDEITTALEVCEQLPGSIGSLGLFIKKVTVLTNAVDEYSFKTLIKSMGDESNEKKVNMLHEYISRCGNERAFELVGYLRKSLLSNSRISLTLIGHCYGAIVKNNRELDQIDIILFSALPELNDFDYSNFLIFLEFTRISPEVIGEYCYFNQSAFVSGTYDIDSVMLSLQKLARLEVVTNDGGVAWGRPSRISPS